MEYHVNRNGQSFGPYPLELLQQYLASGQVLPTDLVWTQGMSDWRPAATVVASPLPSVVDSPAVPLPPSLHWGWVLLLTLLTCGLFSVVWQFVQAAFVKKIDRTSPAIILSIGSILLALLGAVMEAVTPGRVFVPLIVNLCSLACSLASFFSMRRSLQDYYNRQDPIGLELSGVLTFFFNVFYLQYHLRAIAELKRSLAASR